MSLTAADLRELVENLELREVMRKAVEDVLIEFRDSGISMLSVGNGFTVRYKDGTPSDIIRLSTDDGIVVAIRALADYLDK